MLSSHPLLWNAGVAFPLERVHALIVNDIWSDSDSENKWNETYPEYPYQVWTTDPTSTSNAVYAVQDVQIICAWCQSLETFDANEFQLVYTKAGLCRCSSCAHEFNADNLSAQYLRLDLQQFTHSKKW
jgi:hypothetical protein